MFRFTRKASHMKRTRCLFWGFCLPCIFILIPMLARDASNDTNMKLELERISAAVVDLTAEAELLANKRFLQLYHHPNRKAVLDVLADSSVDEQRKRIAVLSMQNVPVRDYVIFLDRVAELREANRVSIQVFEIALFPGYDWNTKLEENYRNPHVVAMLKKLKISGSLDSSQIARVKNILSGRAKQDLRTFRENERIVH